MIERRSSAAPAATIDALIDRAERAGGLRESDIEQLAEQLALDAEALEDLRDQLAACGVASRTTAAAPRARRATTTASSRTTRSTRSISSWPRPPGIACSPRREELALAKRIERGDLAPRSS